MSGVTERVPVEVDHGPARISVYLATVATVVGLLSAAPFALLAAPFSLAGAGLLLVGLYRSESRRHVTLGATGLLAGTIVAAGYGTPPTVLLPGVIASFVAWDVGQQAIEFGETIGRQAYTRRAELVHASASTLVGVLVAAVGYAVYTVASGGQPAPALIFLLLGGVLLMWIIRE